MGTSKTVAELAKKIEKVQQVPASASKAAVRVNAQIAKTNAENAVRDATGGSGRLRNVGKSGASLTVTSRVENNGQQAFVKAVGPWQLIENDTKRHFIGAAGLSKAELGTGFAKSKSGRNTAKGRQGRAKALRTPFGPRRYVEVRGTKGKKPWAKAAEKTVAEVPGVLQKVTHDELVKALG